jgi:hypothetical protein
MIITNLSPFLENRDEVLISFDEHWPFLYARLLLFKVVSKLLFGRSCPPHPL